MAKELPFFKFEPGSWDTGNIQLCTHEMKGLFIDLCSMYWQRLGDLPYKLALQKVCGGNATALDSLCNDKIIKIIEGMICIDFLNEQLSEFEHQSTINRENALEGWKKRRKDATPMRPHSDPNAIREDKRREEERIISFDVFWNFYGKKVNKPKCIKIWDKLKDDEIQEILKHVPEYAKREQKFRKDPERYLSHRTWEDEIIEPSGNNFLGHKTSIPDFI